MLHDIITQMVYSINVCNLTLLKGSIYDYHSFSKLKVAALAKLQFSLSSK